MTDPYVDRRMFPQLTPAQVGRISAVGERRSIRSVYVGRDFGRTDVQSAL